MSAVYEWACEIVTDGETAEHEDNEVLGYIFTDTYAEAVKHCKRTAEAGTRHLVVLVQDDRDGRSWAYVEGSKISASFTDAYGHFVCAVPRRFVKEVENYK